MIKEKYIDAIKSRVDISQLVMDLCPGTSLQNAGKTYKDIIHDEFFTPEMTRYDEVSFPVTLRWGGSEDAEGIEVPVHLDHNPTFFELYFEGEENLMIELGGRWFYKSPKAKVIDLMPAFYEDPIIGEEDMTLRFFAPPASGENDLSLDDGLTNAYQTLSALPKIRIEYGPVL